MQTATKGGVTYTFAYNRDERRISKTSSGIFSHSHIKRQKRKRIGKFADPLYLFGYHISVRRVGLSAF